MRKTVAPDPEPPKPREREREGYNINVWVSEAHGEAFEALKRLSRRSKTAELEVMIEQAAAAAGLWDEPDDKEPEES